MNSAMGPIWTWRSRLELQFDIISRPRCFQNAHSWPNKVQHQRFVINDGLRHELSHLDLKISIRAFDWVNITSAALLGCSFLARQGPTSMLRWLYQRVHFLDSIVLCGPFFTASQHLTTDLLWGEGGNRTNLPQSSQWPSLMRTKADTSMFYLWIIYRQSLGYLWSMYGRSIVDVSSTYNRTIIEIGSN